MAKKNKKKTDKAILKNYDRVILPLEKLFEKKIKKLLQDQAKRIGEAFKKHMTEKKDEDNGITEEEAEKQAQIIVNSFYDFEKDIAPFLKILMSIYIEAGKLGNSEFNKIHFGVATTDGEGVMFAIIRNDYLKWLETYGGSRITNVNATTKYVSARLIRNGLIRGDSIETIAESLCKNISDYSIVRARTIAATEMHNSFMHGNFMSASASGFKYKMWLSARDSHVRSSHQKLNGMVVELDKDFKTGLAYPGDQRAAATETIRCRCVLKYMDSKEG